MKNAIIISLILAVLIVSLKDCKRTQTITVHTEKVDTSELHRYKLKLKAAHDSIDRIKSAYFNKLRSVQLSTRPDTFIQNFTDTVFGNHDSFIYVTILKGQECCELLPWKDSIINEDSIHMVRSEKALKDCEKKAKRTRIKTRLTDYGIFAAIVGIIFTLK